MPVAYPKDPVEALAEAAVATTAPAEVPLAIVKARAESATSSAHPFETTTEAHENGEVIFHSKGHSRHRAHTGHGNYFPSGVRLPVPARNSLKVPRD